MADPIGRTPGTWRHASADYRAWLDDPRSDCALAAKTREGYRKVLKKLDEVFGAALLAEIKPVSIGALLRATRDQPQWGNHLVIGVSVVWRHALRNGLTDAPNPTIGLGKHKTRARETTVSDEWIALLAEHGDQVLRDWLALELVAGQRVSDTLALRRENIVGDELRPPNAKTGKPIRIAITGDLRRVVDELLSRPRKVSGPWLIQTETGRQVTYWMLDRRWRTAMSKARQARPDMPHFQMRDLRAKSATDAPETAQARLGHTNRRMTEKHYLRDVPLADPGVLPGGILDQNSG
jgi:integrase